MIQDRNCCKEFLEQIQKGDYYLFPFEGEWTICAYGCTCELFTNLHHWVVHLLVVHHYNVPDLGEELGLPQDLLHYWLQHCPSLDKATTDFYHQLERIVCERLKVPCQPAKKDYEAKRTEVEQRFKQSYIPTYHFSIFKVAEAGDCIKVNLPRLIQYIYDTPNAKITICFHADWIEKPALCDMIKCYPNAGFMAQMGVLAFSPFVKLEAVRMDELENLNVIFRGAVRPIMHYLATNERLSWVTFG